MKLKIFLVASIALLTCQSTNALQIVLINNFYGTMDIHIKMLANLGDRLPVSGADITLESQGAEAVSFRNSYLIDEIFISYKEFKWILFSDDLTDLNIPVTGNHTIGLFMNNIYGVFGISVDGGKVIGVDGALVSRNHPALAAAAA